MFSANYRVRWGKRVRLPLQNFATAYLEKLAHVVRKRRQGESWELDESAQEHQSQQHRVPRLEVRVRDAHEGLSLAQDARKSVVPENGGQTAKNIRETTQKQPSTPAENRATKVRPESPQWREVRVQESSRKDRSSRNSLACPQHPPGVCSNLRQSLRNNPFSLGPDSL